MDSNIKCGDLAKVFRTYQHLRKLVVTRAKLESLYNCQLGSSSSVVSDTESNSQPAETIQLHTWSDSTKAHYESLEILDLSLNGLSKIEKIFLDNFSKLKELNLSGNAIVSLDSNLFTNLKELQVLDLSSNSLNHRVDPQTFLSLPSGLQYIDISGNSI